MLAFHPEHPDAHNHVSFAQLQQVEHEQRTAAAAAAVQAAPLAVPSVSPEAPAGPGMVPNAAASDPVALAAAALIGHPIDSTTDNFGAGCAWPT